MAGLVDLGWSEAEEPDFWETDERPGRVSIMHGGSAEVIWFPGDEPAETLFELRHDLALTPVAGAWVAIAGEEVGVSANGGRPSAGPTPTRRTSRSSRPTST